jgi:hypothetical protein
MRRFLPSIHPASRSPNSSAFSQRCVFTAENDDRSPIRRTVAACCARAWRGQAANPVERTRKSRRFMLANTAAT